MSTRLLTRSQVVAVLAGGLLIAPALPRVWAQAPKKLTIPKPEVVALDTKLGVTLQCVYFPGGFVQKTEMEVVTKPGKEVVPLILLHGYEGRGADYSALAFALQKQGHAVLVPDLRGHGASNKLKLPNGNNKEIELDKMRSTDFLLMVNDMEALKRFLYEKNNEGLLNVEMLCLVGADLGALIATNWAAYDWSRQQLPAFKQGQTVKALVLLSPPNSLKGYNASAAWKHPIFQSNQLSIMLVAGRRDSKSSNEAKSIFNRIERHHPVPEDPAARTTKQSLFLIEPDTELSGTKLVDPRAKLPVVQTSILTFVTLRLVNRQNEFTWAERKSPLN